MTNSYVVVMKSNNIKKNDIILFRNDRDDFLIKRVVAIAPDVVETKYDCVIINNKLFAETGIVCGEHKYILKKDDFFVMGDNYYESTDSRDYGPIKKKDIKGRVIYILNNKQKLKK